MVLYVAKRGPHDIGTKTHLKGIREVYGEDNVFVIDLLSAEYYESERFISFGYKK